MTTSVNKPVVQFSRKAGVTILHGRALLKPIDHTSQFVSNTKQAITSLILKQEYQYGRIISLETENSIYMEYDDGEYTD